jgi:hypothetical protein
LIRARTVGSGPYVRRLVPRNNPFLSFWEKERKALMEKKEKNAWRGVRKPENWRVFPSAV